MRALARFLLSAALVPAAAVPAAAQSRTAHTTAAVTLRSAPSSRARAVAQVPRARTVRVDACSRAWCAVAYGRARGYVPERYLHAGGQAVAEPLAPSAGRGYVNSRGNWVPSPRRSADGRPPPGASAHCRDGTYSFSQSRRGTCSHHGGVAEWL
jgi:uncharacterized protein YraI